MRRGCNVKKQLRVLWKVPRKTGGEKQVAEPYFQNRKKKHQADYSQRCLYLIGETQKSNFNLPRCTSKTKKGNGVRKLPLTFQKPKINHSRRAQSRERPSNWRGGKDERGQTEPNNGESNLPPKVPEGRKKNERHRFIKLKGGRPWGGKKG